MGKYICVEKNRISFGTPKQGGIVSDDRWITINADEEEGRKGGNGGGFGGGNNGRNGGGSFGNRGYGGNRGNGGGGGNGGGRNRGFSGGGNGGGHPQNSGPLPIPIIFIICIIFMNFFLLWHLNPNP